MSYDFATLSPEDFELLVADLLSREFGAQLEVFKAGKDGGIDLRHSRVLPGQTRAIVQCKRYAPYRYAALVRAMAKELTKVAKLKPERYLLATSVELSASNKDQLVKLLQPWCQGPQDIYGSAEILALIRKYPEVERAHFKLWISSTAVLERVVQSRIFNLTDATVEAAKEQMSRLVIHDGFRRALAVLAEHHYVLIVGNPGIGKTTLARMLMCHYLQEAFDPIVIVGDVGDVWAAVQASSDTERKRVVLYDDFLGQLNFDSVRFGKNEEISLHEFLEKVRRSNRLRFILTTREYILADARRMHGAFAREADQMVRCTVSLDDYTLAHRAKVLFNHLYFSAIPESRLQKLVEQRVYRRIIAHRHFSPRIVEGISNYSNSRAMSDEAYLAYIEQEFDDPRAVWDHPFRYQISPTARQLLILLWTFRGIAEVGELKGALLRLNAAQPPEEVSLRWHDSLRELDGNFLSTTRYPLSRDLEQSVTIVEFQNPSVAEFVEGFALGESVWLERLSEAIVSFRQVDQLMSYATGSRKVRSQVDHLVPEPTGSAEGPLKGPSNDMPDAFWTQLDEAARQLESRPAGYLINRARGSGRSISREWEDSERPSGADRTVTRLKIAGRLQSGAASRRDLTQRLTSADGWREILTGVANDDSEAYAVARLMKSVLTDNNLHSEEKKAIGETFRAYLYQLLLSPDDLWPITVGSLTELARALILFSPEISTEERAAFRAAAIAAANTAEENFDESSMLESEAEAVKEISALCGVDLTKTLDRLVQSVSDQRDEEEPGDDSRPEMERYAAETSSLDQDVDTLFADLLDR